MEYSAVTNFGVFGFGLVTVGEVLSEEIVKALGPETLSSLIERGAVAPMSNAAETLPPPAGGASPFRGGEEESGAEAAAEALPGAAEESAPAADDEFVDVDAEEIADADVVGAAAVTAEAPKKARKRK